MPSSRHDDRGRSADDRSLRPDEPPERVQCPNCCRLAPVIARGMGLLYYRCELCHTIGAAPEDSIEPS